MKKCANPDHPYCTQWVSPNAAVCAAQHPQPVAETFQQVQQTVAEQAARTEKRQEAKPSPASAIALPDAGMPKRRALDSALPHLHFSGFDPRASGGRQTLKIELLGMAAEVGTQLELSLHSALLPNGRAEHIFVRTTRGHWRPVLLEFSSKNREHGQYRMDIELKYLFGGQISRKWVCTPVLLVPRRDASLADIHQIFLSHHKNVKVVVDDASIAKISGYQMADQLDISAKNASIAQLDFNAPKGKVDIGFTSIAWDEDLLEIDLSDQHKHHPEPCNLACLSNSQLTPRALHLFALEQTILGRFETQDPVADLLLAHYRVQGVDNAGLTRRISARHAAIRYIDNRFEIEDISRYGLIIDGKWPGKAKPCILKMGMKIELTASFKNIVALQVVMQTAHALVLQRTENAAFGETYYLLAPDKAIEPETMQWPQKLPLLFHQHGGFWHFDQDSKKMTALTAGASLSSLQGLAGAYQFISQALPD